MKPNQTTFGTYFMTSQRTAKFLGLSCRTLYRFRQKNVGPPYYRIGNRLIRYHVRDRDYYFSNSPDSSDRPSSTILRIVRIG